MLRIILSTIFIIAISALHIAIVTVFSYPFNTVNVTIIAMVFLLMTRRTNLSIAITLFMGTIIDLYAVTPFGVLLVALIISLIVGIALSSYVITTISFLGGVILTLTMVVCYRISFMLFFGLYALSHEEVVLPFVQALQHVAAEAFTTTLIAALLILFFAKRTARSHARIKTTHYGIFQ